MGKGDLKKLIETPYDFNGEAIFTLLMRNVDKEKFTETRSLLFEILKKLSNVEELPDWFLKLIKQLENSKICKLCDESMKELIRLFSEKLDVNFKDVLNRCSSSGNTLLMELAKRVNDVALREVLTNPSTAKCVCNSVNIYNHLCLWAYK